jgi:hypothetical protein
MVPVLMGGRVHSKEFTAKSSQGHRFLSSHISIVVGDGGLLTIKDKNRIRTGFLGDIA